MTRSRAVAAAAVLALHGLLWWAWREPAPPPQHPAAPEPAPLVVRLLWPQPRLQPPPQSQPKAPQAITAARPAAPAAPALQQPVPAVELQAPAAAALPAPVAAVAASAAAPAPLLLDLPRSASAPQRLPALEDPRAHTSPPTLESRIARATAKDWTVEHRPDGRTYYRRGDECRITQPARDTELDPWNSSQRPRQGGNC